MFFFNCNYYILEILQVHSYTFFLSYFYSYFTQSWFFNFVVTHKKCINWLDKCGSYLPPWTTMALLTTLPVEPPTCGKSNLTYFYRNSLQLASGSCMGCKGFPGSASSYMSLPCQACKHHTWCSLFSFMITQPLLSHNGKFMKKTEIF